MTETTEGFTLAITGGKAGKGRFGELLSDGNVQLGSVCWGGVLGSGGVLGCGGVNIPGGDREQALTLNIRIISIRVAKIYLIFFGICSLLYHSWLVSNKFVPGLTDRVI